MGDCEACFLHDYYFMQHVPIIFYLDLIKHRLDHLGRNFQAEGQVADDGGALGDFADGEGVEEGHIADDGAPGDIADGGGMEQGHVAEEGGAHGDLADEDEAVPLYRLLYDIVNQ